MPRLILGFGYKARNGKDTAGEAIVDYYNQQRAFQKKHGLKLATPEAKIFKFADALYEVCRKEYGMVGKDAPLLQKVGDGRRNEFGLTYWIDKLAAKVMAFDGIAIITDVRYTNEAEWVRANGGFTIKVERLKHDGDVFITDDRDPNFISEVQLDDYNFDAYISTKYAALTAESAITVAEFFRGLTA